MKQAIFTLILVGFLGASAWAQTYETISDDVRFEWVDVFVDPGDATLAAWQAEIVTEAGDVKIVGVEGGEPAAFRNAPYYDPAALANDRVILAAFSTGKDLPMGRSRVARVHVRVAGKETPRFAIKNVLAASADGNEIQASGTVQQGD